MVVPVSTPRAPMSATVPCSGLGSIVKMVSNTKAKLKNIIASSYHNTCHYYSSTLEEHAFKKQLFHYLKALALLTINTLLCELCPLFN